MFVVKVPGINADNGVNEGCQLAGNELLKELRNIWGNEAGVPINVDSLDIEEIHIDNKNLEVTNKLIYENALETFETKPKTIFLGGDHSISYSLVKAFLKNCREKDKEPCLIMFDSHPDCMPPLNGWADHGEWMRKLIEEEGFPPKNILMVGIRNPDKEEIIYLKEKGIRTISINQLLLNIEDSCDIIMEFSSGKELYVSFDMDVIDPAFAPAVSFREPGGISSREAIYLIQRVNKIKNLKAWDLVEINPKRDEKHDNITVKLGAKILGELL